MTILILIVGGCASNNTKPLKANKFSDVLIDYPTTHDAKADLYRNILLGRIAAGQSNYKAALEYYLAALQLTPNIELVREALTLSEQLKNKEASFKIATLWVTQQPEALLPWKLLSYYYLRSQHKAESYKQLSRDAIEKVILLEPNNNELLIFLKLLASAENQLKVLPLYQSLSLEHPDKLALSLALATLYQQQKNWSKALSLTTSIIEQHSDNILAWMLKGEILVASGQQEKAIDWYKKTLEKHTKSNAIRNSLGQLYYELDRYSQAREQFEQILINLPNDTDARYMIAAIYYSEENYQLSKDYFEPLLRYRRLRNSVLFYLAEIATHDNDNETAITLYRQITSSRYYSTAHLMVSRLLQQQGKEQQALEYLKSLSPKDNDINFRYMRAMAAAEMGAMDVTESDLRAILQVDPDHTDALNALGYTLADANRELAEAFIMIERAFTKNPSSPAIIDSMGWVLYRLGRLEEAVDYLQQAYELDKSAEIAAHLGEILWHLDQKHKALDIFSKAIKLSPDNEALKTIIQQLNININLSSTQR